VGFGLLDPSINVFLKIFPEPIITALSLVEESGVLKVNVFTIEPTSGWRKFNIVGRRSKPGRSRAGSGPNDFARKLNVNLHARVHPTSLESMKGSDSATNGLRVNEIPVDSENKSRKGGLTVPCLWLLGHHRAGNAARSPQELQESLTHGCGHIGQTLPVNDHLGAFAAVVAHATAIGALPTIFTTALDLGFARVRVGSGALGKLSAPVLDVGRVVGIDSFVITILNRLRQACATASIVAGFSAISAANFSVIVGHDGLLERVNSQRVMNHSRHVNNISDSPTEVNVNVVKRMSRNAHRFFGRRAPLRARSSTRIGVGDPTGRTL